jgi:alkylhydroperoxidase family enzyme
MHVTVTPDQIRAAFESVIQELREQFSDPELVELTFLIGYINMLNLFNNCLGVRYAGEYQALAPAPG